MKIKTRIVLSTGISIGLALVVVFILFVPMKGTKKLALKYKNNTILVQSVTDLIVTTEEFLVFRYPRCEQQWIVSYEKISDLVKADPNYSEKLNPKLTELMVWFDRIRQITIQNNDLSRPKVLSEKLSPESILESRLSTNIRLTARSILTEILSDSQILGASYFQISNRAFAATIACLVILILIFTVNAFFLIQNVIPPLEQLVKKAGRIMAGDLNQDSKPGLDGSKIGSNDEIGELSTAFDSMTKQLVGSLSHLKNEVKKRKLSEDKFRAIYQQSPIAIEIYDKEGKLTDVNQKTLSLFGVEDKKYVLGFNLWSDPNISAEEIEQLQSGQAIFISSVFDFDLVKSNNLYPTTRSGKIYWDLFAIPIVKNEKIEGYLVQVIEVTKRKIAEQQLKESREQFEIAMDAAEDGLYDWNLLTNEIYYSPGYKRMLGYEDHELDNDFSIWENLTKPEDIKRSWKMLQELLEKKRDRFEIEFKMKHKDGHWVDILSRAKASFDDDGKAVRVIGTHVDISERKQLETNLLQAQKMESIGTLAGGIAHEFNNMLAIIMGNNELVMEEVPQGSLARESTEEIRVAGLRARDVVKQLLTFSRQDDAAHKVMDFTSVVQESIKLVRSLTPVNIKIEHNISADTYPVMGNETQINQLIINLCNNAVDALQKNGGSLTIELLNETIDIQQTIHQTKLAPGQYAKLIVSDNGIGMEPEILGRVFEPYFTTKDIGKGTGIGMAVVHGIVERHGGAIIVDSKPGKGTTFTVFLPAHESLLEKEIEGREILPVGDENILYVDDELSLAKLGKRLLDSLGYTTESISDPEIALDMIRSNPDKFDLLITDLAMPTMTGDQLVIETLKIRNDMPTIICTGYSANISEKEAMDIGVRSYIMKPINKSELAKMVRKVLDETKMSNLEKH